MVLRDNPLQADALKRGLDSLRRNNLDEAIAQLESAVRGQPMFADLARAYLARALTAKGDKAGAAKAARTRSLYNSFSGGRVIRLDTDYNDIMRAVAAENGVEVIEGAQVVEERPADFIDYCHFNAGGHRRLGELLARRIAPRLGQ
jgi:lysophospholipase L1-like esterase